MEGSAGSATTDRGRAVRASARPGADRLQPPPSPLRRLRADRGDPAAGADRGGPGLGARPSHAAADGGSVRDGALAGDPARRAGSVDTGGAYAAGGGAIVRASGLRDAVALLQCGRDRGDLPGGIPGVDPTYTPKTESEPHLPFRAGFALLLGRAQRDGSADPADPGRHRVQSGVGGRTGATLRFGGPIRVESGDGREAIALALAARVRALSGGQDTL